MIPPAEMTEPTAEQDDRPSVYFEGGIAYYRASAVGGSSHVLAASRAGVKPAPFSEKTLQHFSEGRLHEPAILDSVARDGWLLSHTGRDQAELDIAVSRSIVIRCHPDGFAVASRDHPFAPKGTRCVVEAKAMTRSVFARWDHAGFSEFYRYATQLSIQMHASGLPGLFAVKNRDDGTVRWQVLAEAPIPWVDIRKRLLLIDTGARDGDLNPLKEKCRSWPCPFFFTHDEQPADITEDSIVDGLAEMVDEARSRRKQAEEIERQARDRLLKAMGEREKVHTPRWRVSVSNQRRPRYDHDGMKRDGIDLEPYTTWSEFAQMRVVEAKVES